MGLLLLVNSIFILNVALLPTLEAEPCDLSDVKGLFVPVFSPMDENGTVSVSIIPQYGQYLKDSGAIDGIVGMEQAMKINEFFKDMIFPVAATTGEGPTLNTSDNKLILDAWMAIAPSLGFFVISEVGAEPLPDAQEMAAYSEELGVDAIMVLPPVYYRPETPEELVYYMQFIYEAAPNTPLIYDHSPQYTDVDVDMEEFLELATDEIPTFKGVKSDVFETSLILQNKINDDQKIYASDPIALAAEVFMGFDSIMSAELNLFPELIAELVTTGQEGNLTQSRSIYYELVELAEAVIDQVNRTAALKTAMPLISGIDVGDVRPPLIPLTDEEKASLRARLEEKNITIS